MGIIYPSVTGGVTAEERGFAVGRDRDTVAKVPGISGQSAYDSCQKR